MTQAEYTSPRYISVADTAKLIRVALKENFPGIKFSVKSKSYSGGASIRISYTDGPLSSKVEAVTHQFSGATFDGMIDLKSHHESILNGERVHYGADYVFVNRDYSVAFMTRVVDVYCTWEHCPKPMIMVSEYDGTAYIDPTYTRGNRVQEECQRSVWLVDESDLEGLQFCISHGRIAVKRADTEEDRIVDLQPATIKEKV